jgi:hypothetical protein
MTAYIAYSTLQSPAALLVLYIYSTCMLVKCYRSIRVDINPYTMSLTVSSGKFSRQTLMILLPTVARCFIFPLYGILSPIGAVLFCID